MYFVLGFLLFFAVLVWLVMSLPVFGRNPVGERLRKIKNLVNYEDGEIKNQSPTPMKPEGISYWTMFRKMIKGNENGAPKKPLPHLFPDFAASEAPKITWFGHSSYLIQVDGLNILVDPVFTERPSPFQFIGTKRFEGTDFVNVEDFPKLDVVLITHDHFDHLDYQAILKLKDKTTYFVTSIGVGEHLNRWGVKNEKLFELAWNEQIELLAGLTFTALPARHFSGRTFKRNLTAWSSFALKTKHHKLYLGGDSGHDRHFKEIGDQHGPFDLAILECGQYNEMWPLIHMFPEQVAEASIELGAKVLFPVHWGKYKLALHNWDEPIERVTKKAEELGLTIVNPKLGESFTLGEMLPNTKWWRNL